MENILLVEDRIKLDGKFEEGHDSSLSESETAFKLADLGFAKFKHKPQDNAGHIPTERLTGGTLSFGMSFKGEEDPSPRQSHILTLALERCS